MSTKTLSFFSTEVDKGTLDDILGKGQKTVIQELEMMAVLAAVRVRRKLIKSCRVVLFTDSEAVRGASNSADAEAHWPPLPGLKKNGAFEALMSRANHLFLGPVHSQPAMTTKSSVHLASVRC